MSRPWKIISGGQTGADQAALVAAQRLGIRTGGYAPFGWRTETGPAPWLARFGLVQDDSADYQPRTKRNIRASDGTVIFGDVTSAGSKLAIGYCQKIGRPYILNPTGEELRQWCDLHMGLGAGHLNVAGNRASSNPGIAAIVQDTLFLAFRGEA